MPRLRSVELSNVISRLSDVAPFSPQAERVDGSQELFLCALGFEPRCRTLPKLLADTGYRYNRAAYFVYSTNANENDANRPGLLADLACLSNNITSIAADSLEVSQRVRSLLTNLNVSAAPKRPRVTLDVSVVANRLVMSCLAVLLEFDVELRIIYSEAAVYHPTKSEYESDKARWRDESHLGLERGVLQVDVSREHPGQHFDPLPDAIIIFPTFKSDRSRAIISNIDPALLRAPGEKVWWLLGIPHLEENYWRVQALREINELRDYHL